MTVQSIYDFVHHPLDEADSFCKICGTRILGVETTNDKTNKTLVDHLATHDLIADEEWETILNPDKASELDKRYALYELEQVNHDEEYAIDEAITNLERIVNEAQNLKKRMESPNFKKYLDTHTLGWITTYSDRYIESITKAKTIHDSIQGFRHSIAVIEDLRITKARADKFHSGMKA